MVVSKVFTWLNYTSNADIINKSIVEYIKGNDMSDTNLEVPRKKFSFSFMSEEYTEDGTCKKMRGSFAWYGYPASTGSIVKWAEIVVGWARNFFFKK